jgi:CPA2 family monovalent cation:H+ antiporter-2
VEDLVAPLRQLFSGIFFIAMGLMISPLEVWSNAGVVVLVTAVMIVGKVVGGTALCLLIGEEPYDALRIGRGLAQVAEFAFIIAVVGDTLKITERPVFQIAVGAAVLSTLLNPFLMRLADPISRAAPKIFGPRFAEWLEAYSGWLHRIFSPQADRLAFGRARRDFFYLALNLTLIAAVFLVAEYVRSAHLLDQWLQLHNFPTPSGSPMLWGLGLWGAAALAASPFYAAAFRILNHLAKNLAAAFTPENASPWIQNFQVLLRRVFVLLGVVAMAVCTFLFSSNLLPDWKFQLLLMAVLAAVIAYHWKWLTRAHTSAQEKLHELFQRESPRNELRSVLTVHMREVSVRKGYPCVGQTIISLNIRARAGASVISVRHGENYNVNPSLNEPFTPGNSVLLLGNDAELDAAETLLTGLPPQGE